MTYDPATQGPHVDEPQPMLKRALGAMSIFTLAMTLPQMATIWIGRQAAGVSAWSWGAYLFSALLWFAYGLRKGDRNIWLPCIGWIVLDAGILAGALRFG